MHDGLSRTLDVALQPFLRPGFFFINIGANNGVDNDPIYPFIRRYGWRGIVVEPVDYVFAELCRNYRDLEGIVFEHAAITPTPSARKFFHLTEHAGDALPFQRQIGSLKQEYVLKTIALMRMYRFQGPVRDDLEASVVSVDVPCLTFDELVAKHGVEHVDFLNVDAEGSDYDIFCSIDLERYRPAVLCLETVELAPDQDRDVRGRFARLGYRFLERFDLYSEIFVRA